MVDENEKFLCAFLKNISCLKEIEADISKETVFDVLGMSHYEIRHSRLLQWLLDPHGTHGLGARFLRAFLQCVCDAGGDVFKLMTVEFDTFRVCREYKHIDLLLVSDESKMVIAIENKIDSSEHDNQLLRYEKVLDEDFPKNKFHRTLVYLAPDRTPSSQNWLAVGYNPDVLKAIRCCGSPKFLAPDVALLIEHYQELIEKEFMKKDKLAEVCNKIYREHREALDLIFELKEDPARVVRSKIEKWFEDKGSELGLILDKAHSSKAYIRFSTAKLETFLPLLTDGKKSAWGSEHCAYYEINNRECKVSVKLQCSSINMPESTMATVRKIVKEKGPAHWTYKSMDLAKNVCLKRKEGDVEWSDKEIGEFMGKVARAVMDFESDITRELRTGR